jgi:AcrR family transcriptional regulator
MATAPLTRKQTTEATRAALLAAAAELLEAQGFDAVTLRAVGQKAGVTQSAAYRHFSSKRDLLVEVSILWFMAFDDMLVAASERARTPRTRLEALLGAYLDYVMQHPVRYRLMLGPDLLEDGDPRLHAYGLKVFSHLVEAVAQCQKVGLLEAGDARQLAAVLYSGLHGMGDLATMGFLHERKGMQPDKLLRLLLEQFWRG